MIFLVIKYTFLGKFQHELLDKSFNWTTETSLVDIAKAIVQRIDETDTYHSKNYGLRPL